MLIMVEMCQVGAEALVFRPQKLVSSPYVAEEPIPPLPLKVVNQVIAD